MKFNSKFDNRRYQRYFVNLAALYQKKEIIVYTGLALSLFAIAFFGVFALRPTLVTIAGLYQEIQNQKTINQKLQTKINNLRQAQENYAQVANSVYLVNQALPLNPSLTEIVYPIEILAQKESLNLTSINFNPVDLAGENPKQKTSKTTSGLAEIGFDLTLKGDFEKLKTFLESLEKVRRIIAIDSFSLNQGKVGETSIMTLNLTGRAFYYEVE